MVRRVTKDQAWVFVATSEDCTARLLVGQGALDQTSLADAGQAGTSRAHIGARLFVGVIRANLFGIGNQLVSYDIRLRIPDGETTLDLRLGDLGLLGGTGDARDAIEREAPLGYHPGRLPSFVTPPDQ